MEDEEEFMEKFDNDFDEPMSLDEMRIAIHKNTNWRIFQQILLFISLMVGFILLINALSQLI